VAPIALLTSAKANQSTDLLAQYILDGNRNLLTRLQPTRGGSPDGGGNDVDARTDAAIPRMR
jgi:hypothetical protein